MKKIEYKDNKGCTSITLKKVPTELHNQLKVEKYKRRTMNGENVNLDELYIEYALKGMVAEEKFGDNLLKNY